MKTTLVIGDIHGCLSTLKALITKAGPVDEIISVGDLIDRGPDSLGVVKYCIDNNIKVCLGNHEQMAIIALTDHLGPNHPYKRMNLLESDWFANGGGPVFDSCTVEDLEFLLDYFKTLPIYIKTDYISNDLPVVVSHTCLNNYAYDILNATQDDLRAHADSFVWTRTQAVDVAKFFNIYGHTPTDYLGLKGAVPKISKTGVNLDTGCVYQSEGRGKLTGILLPSMQIIQQERL
jgi:serine/threonine protein phosphatase 1